MSVHRNFLDQAKCFLKGVMSHYPTLSLPFPGQTTNQAPAARQQAFYSLASHAQVQQPFTLNSFTEEMELHQPIIPKIIFSDTPTKSFFQTHQLSNKHEHKLHNKN